MCVVWAYKYVEREVPSAGLVEWLLRSRNWFAIGF